MAELGAGGGSGYPGVIDTDAILESGATQARSNVPNDYADAIINIQTELGVNPAGSVADLVTRLAVSLNDDGTIAKLDQATTIEIEPSAAVTALLFDQNNNAISADFQSSSTTADVINIDAATTTGKTIDVNAIAINSGIAIEITTAAITTGKCLVIADTSSTATTAKFIDFSHLVDVNGLANKSGVMGQMYIRRKEQRVAGTTTDNYDVLHLTRECESTGAGGTFTQLGSILKLTSTLTQTAGILTSDTLSIEIDHNSRSASDVYAIEITSDNAGAGDPGGIDMSTFAAGEPLLHLPVDANAEGAYYGRYAVYVVGVGTKYVSLFEA